MREEIGLFGVDYARRGAWSDEALRIMRACWREERPSFRGEFVSFAPVGFAPKPPRGTIPVWIGGHTPRALRRVAELGGGWHAPFTRAEKMKGGLAALAAACPPAGRAVKTPHPHARPGLPAP